MAVLKRPMLAVTLEPSLLLLLLLLLPCVPTMTLDRAVRMFEAAAAGKEVMGLLSVELELGGEAKSSACEMAFRAALAEPSEMAVLLPPAVPVMAASALVEVTRVLSSMMAEGSLLRQASAAEAEDSRDAATLEDVLEAAVELKALPPAPICMSDV